MVDKHADFKALLDETGIETVYEHFIDRNDNVPIISYLEIGNTDIKTGHTDNGYLSYSSVTYQVKLFTKSVQEMQTIVCNLDKIMKQNGWKRTMCYDSTDGQLIMKIMKYSTNIYDQGSF